MSMVTLSSRIINMRKECWILTIKMLKVSTKESLGGERSFALKSWMNFVTKKNII